MLQRQKKRFSTISILKTTERQIIDFLKHTRGMKAARQDFLEIRHCIFLFHEDCQQLMEMLLHELGLIEAV